MRLGIRTALKKMQNRCQHAPQCGSRVTLKAEGGRVQYVYSTCKRTAPSALQLISIVGPYSRDRKRIKQKVKGWEKWVSGERDPTAANPTAPAACMGVPRSSLRTEENSMYSFHLTIVVSK